MGSKIFVNRVEELEQLTKYYNESKGGKPNFIFISGESGSGKALLVEEFINRLPDKVIFYTHFAKVEDKIRPYTPYTDFLRFLEKNDDMDNEPKELIHQLSQQLKKSGRGAIESEREILFNTFTNLFESASKNIPLIFYLDNIQWYDVESILLTKHLAFNVGINSQLLFIAAYRPEELEEEDGMIHPVTSLLTELMMEGLLRTFQIERLDRDSSCELISKILKVDDVPEKLLDFIMEETEGSPMFISELLNTMIQTKSIDLSDPSWSLSLDYSSISTPGGIKEAIARRIHLADEDSLEVLRRASILGVEFSVPDLCNLVDKDESEISTIMSGLIEKKIIFEVFDRTEETYKFDHSKIWEVLYGEVSSDEKRKYHKIAGEILLGKPNPDIYVLANHFYNSEDLENGLKYCMSAGEQAYSNAPNEAIRHYSFALELIQKLDKQNSKSKEKAEILYKIGDANYIIGEWEKSKSHLEKALELARDVNDDISVVQNLSKLGEIAKFKGDFDDASKIFQEILNISTEIGYEEGIAIGYGGIGYIQWRQGNFDDAKASYELCIQSASKTVNLKTLGIAHIEFGNVFTATGNLEMAETHYNDAIDILNEVEEYSQVARAYNNLGDASLQRKDWDRAIENFSKCREIAEKVGYKDMMAWSLFNTAEAQSKKGLLDEALLNCEKAIPLLENMGDKVGLSGAHKNMGIIYRFKKEWKKAEEHFTMSIETEREMKTPHPLIETYIETGWMYFDKGDKKKAEETLQTAIDLAAEINANEFEKRARDALAKVKS